MENIRYLKSRVDIREAAIKRRDEVRRAKESALVALRSVMERFDIPTPEEIVDRLVTASRTRSLDTNDEELVALAKHLTIYERAKGAEQTLNLIIDHVDTLGRFADEENGWRRLPPEMHIVSLHESEVRWLFYPYETEASSPNYYDPGSVEKARGAYELRGLLARKPDAGLSTVLRG